MSCFTLLAIVVPTVLSILLCLTSAVMIAVWCIKPSWEKKRNQFTVNRNTGRHLMLFSIVLLGAVWALRFAIGNFCCAHPVEGMTLPTMSAWDQVFNSFLHALQTFSMDEDYTEYTRCGQELFAFLLPKVQRTWIFSTYIAAMNVVAPIAGGAFVFEMLASIFPQIQFRLSSVLWWKTRCFFTALNEQSLAMARSIVTDPYEKSVSVIFTDAYADDENEESTELLLSAKALGAICIKDDLLHISLRKLGCRKSFIFLSDRDESENLQTLSQLLEPDMQKQLVDAQIFVFGTDDRTSGIEDEVIYLHNRLSAEYKAHGQKIQPSVVPVNGIRNMAQSLFYRLPLFECLYDGKNKDRAQQINLTIIGSGVIGTEVFLNAYWFGQIAGVQLNINVISKEESEQQFKSRIDFINPEIMATSEENNSLLCANIVEKNGECSQLRQAPYFRFRFKQTDVLADSIDRLLTEKLGEGKNSFQLRDTDYFVVAIGSDEDNFCVADKLRQAVGAYHLSQARSNKTIISYVIYNSSLSRSLNCRARQKYVSADDSADDKENKTDDEKTFDVFMHAFGSMEEIYSADNILHSKIIRNADHIADRYQHAHAERGDGVSPENEMFKAIREKKYYNKRANSARQQHRCYKSYCAGFLQATLFRSESDEQYNNYLEECENFYTQQAQKLPQRGVAPEQWIIDEDKQRLLDAAHRVAWTEHRRWNAFMRINGFRCPGKGTDTPEELLTAVGKYSSTDSDVHSISGKEEKDYQFMFLKLHPCLVECDLSMICYEPEFTENPPENEACCTRKVPEYTPLSRMDELDRLSAEFKTAFKIYDYPEYE